MTALPAWRPARDRGRPPPAAVQDAPAVRKARERLAQLQAAAQAATAGEGAGDKPRQPVRNITDPDSRLMPVRGGGFKQGYNCQDAAADDRLMLGGYACQDTGDARQARQLDQVAARGAAVVAAGHAAHAGDPVLLRRCHDRLCRSKDRTDPGHDIAACHAAITGDIGTIVKDAGYYSEENISAPGPDRLIGNRHEADTYRCVLVSPDDDLVLALRENLPAKRLGPEPGQARQIVGVDDDVVEADGHVASMRGTPGCISRDRALLPLSGRPLRGRAGCQCLASG